MNTDRGWRGWAIDLIGEKRGAHYGRLNLYPNLFNGLTVNGFARGRRALRGAAAIRIGRTGRERATSVNRLREAMA